jgi:hypothetical protein
MSNPKRPLPVVSMMSVALGAFALTNIGAAAAPAHARPSTSPTTKSPVPAVSSKSVGKPVGKKSRFPSGGMPESARGYYAMKWGVDELTAKLTESSQLVRFTYRVTDPKKAASLQDHAAAPSMLDARARVALQVPTMEKVGPLRQQMAAQSGKIYWIAFSNKGFPVKTGDQVSVVIGPFRVDGLIVQ